MSTLREDIIYLQQHPLITKGYIELPYPLEFQEDTIKIPIIRYLKRGEDLYLDRNRPGYFIHQDETVSVDRSLLDYITNPHSEIRKLTDALELIYLPFNNGTSLVEVYFKYNQAIDFNGVRYTAGSSYLKKMSPLLTGEMIDREYSISETPEHNDKIYITFNKLNKIMRQWLDTLSSQQFFNPTDNIWGEF